MRATWPTRSLTAAKVLDFGIARMAGTHKVTRTGNVMGTPLFMAPEQARGQTKLIDHQSDLWAVGAVFFRSLTGRYVYESETPEMTLVAAATEPPPRLEGSVLAVDPELCAIVDRALAPTKEARWPSADSMLEALRALGSERLVNDPRKSPTGDPHKPQSTRTLDMREPFSGAPGTAPMIASAGAVAGPGAGNRNGVATEPLPTLRVLDPPAFEDVHRSPLPTLDKTARLPPRGGDEQTPSRFDETIKMSFQDVKEAIKLEPLDYDDFSEPSTLKRFQWKTKRFVSGIPPMFTAAVNATKRQWTMGFSGKPSAGEAQASRAPLWVFAVPSSGALTVPFESLPTSSSRHIGLPPPSKGSAGQQGASKPQCEPNYVLDAKGDKHFKKECFLTPAIPGGP